MQISDLLQQYNNLLMPDAKTANGLRGVEQLVSTLSRLTEGQIFEGTVLSSKDNVVTLGLSSGQSIAARLESTISLNQGQSVFFQVKSNDGRTVQIRPLLTSADTNPTWNTALESASLPVSEKSLNMVRTMMQEGMPIDAESLTRMNQVISSYDAGDTADLVLMSKLNIPISRENLSQFQNYKANEAAILDAVDSLSDANSKILVSSSVSTNDIIQFEKNLLTLLNLPQTMEADEPATIETEELNVNQKSLAEAVANDASTSEAISNKPISETYVDTNALQDLEESNPIFSSKAFSKLEDIIFDVLSNNSALNELFTEDGEVRNNLTPSKFLEKLVSIFEESNLPKEDILKIISSKGYRNMLTSIMKDSWSLQPEELSHKDVISHLYEKLTVHTSEIEKLAEQLTKDPENSFSRASSQLRQNIEFMNTINENYTYVQLPLKMYHQNATGDLFVYQNKRHSSSEDEEVSAFLHFDLKYLGSTDISVKLLHKNIDTEFYLDSDESYQLIYDHLDELEARLKNRGFYCHLKVNHTDDCEEGYHFLSRLTDEAIDQNSTIQRFSFDVRA